MYVVPVKSKVKISQNFVTFSEYMNFNALTKVPSSPNTDPPQFIYNLGHNKYSKSCEITFSVKQKTVLKFYLTRIFQQKV